MNSKLNVAYSYSWFLPDADTAQVHSIIESLRQYTIDLGSESVSDVVVLIGNEAQVTRPDAECVIMFTAIIPNARGESVPQSYGLGFSPEKKKVLVVERGRESFQLQRDQRNYAPRSSAGHLCRDHVCRNDNGVPQERRGRD